MQQQVTAATVGSVSLVTKKNGISIRLFCLLEIPPAQWSTELTTQS